MRKIGLWQHSSHVALLAVVVDFTVGGTLLTNLGSSYVSEGGSLLAKIHPGSYMAILAGILRVWERLQGDPRMRTHKAQDGFVVAFVVGMLFCCAYALVCTGFGGLIALIDSFLPAGMLALALADSRNDMLLRLRHVLQSLLLVNAGLAVFEAMAQWHLVPSVLSGGTAATEFRATALYDHPLTGAAATMIGLFLRPDIRRKPFLGTCYLALMLAALLSFSERTPLALAGLSMFVCYIGDASTKVLRRRLRWQDAVSALAISGALLLSVTVALAGGVGSRLEDHLYWDASAQVRLAQFEILKTLTLPEIIFGCTRSDLIALIEPMRLAAGVEVLENFWLVMLATLGAFCFPIFVMSLALLLWSMWRTSRLEGRMMIVSLMITASASNSFGRKSTLLAMLVACVAATLGRAGPALPPNQNLILAT